MALGYRFLSCLRLASWLEQIGLVIGKGGETIKSIQERTRTKIQIPREPDPNIFPPIR